MKKILFVAGYGRSGSTLIERILNAHDRIFACGELKYLLTEATLHGVFEDSVVWRDVRVALEAEKCFDEEVESYRAKLESLPSGLAVACGLSSKGRESLGYQQFSSLVFSALERFAPEGTEWFVDSSKTGRDSFFRPSSLKNATGRTVKMLHVVRDPRACFTSILKGSNRKMERGEDPELSWPMLRIWFSWNLANLGAHLYGFFNRKDYIRVRYEDYVQQPRVELERIGILLGLSLEGPIKTLESGAPLPIADQVYGNRMRKDSAVVLRSDDSWKGKISGFQWFILTISSLVLIFCYRYPIFKKKASSCV